MPFAWTDRRKSVAVCLLLNSAYFMSFPLIRAKQAVVRLKAVHLGAVQRRQRIVVTAFGEYLECQETDFDGVANRPVLRLALAVLKVVGHVYVPVVDEP